MTGAAAAELVLTARAAQVDRLVAAAFERTRPEISAVAVGGYGRRELFPYSDVDLLLLVERIPETARDKEALAEFLRILWDDGLRVSQSVRTVADCCELHEGNLELTISLLDRRFLCGNAGRFAELEGRFPRFLGSEKSSIAHELSKAARARHAKHQDTIYHLEPNVKEHPGALRDIHVIHWLARLGGADVEEIQAARRFIFEVRWFLHDHYRRDNNLLSFEAQELVDPNPSQWMRGYYRNAREIFRAVKRALDTAESANASLLAQFRDWRGRVSNSEFTVSRERVFLRDPQRLEVDPELTLRLALFVSRHQLLVAPDTERRLALAAAVEPRWPELRELFSLPHCAFGLRLLHETGLLRKMIPEWERIDCVVVRDFYQRYTVDEHTLLAIEALAQVSAAKDGIRGQFAELASEIERPDLLRLALLLHDIGKGTDDHVTTSLDIARVILKRWAAPEGDRATVEFLVQHQLDLSTVMTSRDLGDPATARHLVFQAGTIERLKLLALMTYADISAVNPAALTPWRLEQLWRTYDAARRELTRELDTERIQPEPNSPRAEFLLGFPTRYLRTHSDAEIDRHLELASSGNGIDLEKTDGTYQITVIAFDRPYLLASISGALASFGLNILKAEAFSNRQGLVLDTFVFADPLRTLELNPSEMDRLRDTVRRCILGKIDIAQLLSKRPRPAASGRVKCAVSFNNDLSATSTLIEIVAADRPGLLYDLTSAISAAGCNIEVVLIDTEAQRALDVFYVTSGGKKLSPEVESLLRRNLEAACTSKLLPST